SPSGGSRTRIDPGTGRRLSAARSSTPSDFPDLPAREVATGHLAQALGVLAQRLERLLGKRLAHVRARDRLAEGPARVEPDPELGRHDAAEARARRALERDRGAGRARLARRLVALAVEARVPEARVRADELEDLG